MISGDYELLLATHRGETSFLGHFEEEAALAGLGGSELLDSCPSLWHISVQGQRHGSATAH